MTDEATFPNLPDMLGVEMLEQLIRPWAAFSPTNITFTHAGKLILGVNADAVRTIPEVGDLLLTGGFNRDVEGLPSLAEVADAYAKLNMGITLRTSQCSGFRHCEYDMRKIVKPLNTKFGPIPIKRIAFHRVVILDPEQEKTIQPGNRLKSVRIISRADFDDMLAQEPANVSFPHEVEAVQEAFDLMEDVVPANRQDLISDYGSYWTT